MVASRKKPARARRPSRLAVVRAENEQLRRARLVQQGLLPPPTEVPGLEVVARFLPSREVGGDFYDYFQLDPRFAGLYIGDVQGKGLEAAMYALLVSGIMRGLPKTGNEPANVLGFLNSRLALRTLPEKFCCLTYALFDLEQRRLSVANAGLPFPLLRRGDTLTRVEVPGFPLGMFVPAGYDQGTVTLQSGDELIFYTDGLPDSLESLRPRAGDGESQVAAVVGSHTDESAAALAEALTRHLQPNGRAARCHELPDDVAFLVVRVL